MRRTVSLASLLLAAPLAAHEFWLQPEKHFTAPGATLAVSLQLGEDFTGEVRPLNTERVVAFRHYSATGGVDARPRLSAPPGTHLLCEDTRPGRRLGFPVFFDGKPLAGALVRAWHHREKNLVLIKGRTTADGTIAFDLT